MPHRLKWATWILLACYWVALAVATHVPSYDHAPSPPDNSDKLGHFVAFAGLAFLLLWSTAAATRRARPAWALAIAAVYGGLDEWAQRFVPSRVPDVWDFLADVCGSLVGVGVGILTLACAQWLWGRRRVAEPAVPPGTSS